MVSTAASTNSHLACTPALKHEAIRQVIEQGCKVVDVATRIGISRYTLYGWVQRTRMTGGSAASTHAVTVRYQAEVRRLRAELKRITEEQARLEMVSTHRSAVYASHSLSRSAASSLSTAIARSDVLLDT